MIDIQWILLLVFVTAFIYTDRKNKIDKDIRKVGYGISIFIIGLWIWELYDVLLVIFNSNT